MSLEKFCRRHYIIKKQSLIEYKKTVNDVCLELTFFPSGTNFTSQI